VVGIAVAYAIKPKKKSDDSGKRVADVELVQI
jgi:hypothetical protein